MARTGRPVSILRGGVELSIVRKDLRRRGKRAARSLPDLIAGDPDELIHL